MVDCDCKDTAINAYKMDMEDCNHSHQVDTETVSHGKGGKALQRTQPRADLIKASSGDIINGCGILVAKSSNGKNIYCGKEMWGKERYCAMCSQNVQKTNHKLGCGRYYWDESICKGKKIICQSNQLCVDCSLNLKESS